MPTLINEVVVKRYETFVNQLKARLKEPLPGRDAQIKMAPRPIDERRFKENASRPPKLGGVMILLYPDDSGVYMPLMKRPVYEGVHSGQISFPGGKFEKGDKSLVETALRETHEEIGIVPEKIEVLGTLSEMFIIASNFKVLPTVGVLYEKPTFIPDPIEVADVLPMALTALQDQAIRKTKTMHYPPYTIHSPYFDIKGEVVWGATAMMLSELGHLIQDMDY